MEPIGKPIQEFMEKLSLIHLIATKQRQFQEMAAALVRSKLADGEAIERRTFDNISALLKEEWHDETLRTDTAYRIALLRVI